MKRKFGSVLAMLLVTGMLLTACGGNGGSGASTSTSKSEGGAATGGTDTITVWSKDRHDQEYMQGLIDELNAEYDDMEVELEIYTDNYPNTIEIAASTGELPDIVMLTNQDVTDSLLMRDLFYYIDDYASADFLDTFDKSMFIEGVNMKDGKIFSLPNTGTALRLVYNKDVFERVGLEGPPTSMDEMVEYATKITNELSGEGIYGFALPMKNPTSGFQRGATSIPQLSGESFQEGFDFSTGTYDFGPFKPVAEGLRNIFATGVAFPGCESLEIDPLRTQFADGKIGMYMTYNHSEWGVYTNQFPTEQNWAYAVLPSVTGEITGTQKLSAGTWFAMTKNAESPEKAWRVLEKFYSADVQVPYYENGLGVSVREDVKAAAQPPAGIEYTPMMAIQDTDKIWPNEPRGLVIEGDDWGTMFGAYVFGQLDDIDGIVEDLNTRYTAAYEKVKADGTQPEILYPNFEAKDPAGTAN